MNISVRTAWKSNRKASERVNAHRHEYNELVFYHSGEGETWVGAPYAFSPGDLAIIPAGTLHSELHMQDGEVLCIGFLCDEAMTAEVRHDSMSLIQLAERVVHEISAQEYGFRRMAEIYLEEILIRIRREMGYEAATFRFEYVAEYLRSNFRGKISLAGLAKQLHMSYEYFRHRFRDNYGASPQKFLIEARLNAAAQQLIETDNSCTQIAENCGFSDSAQFSMMFRRRFGMTPTEYRRRDASHSYKN